MIHFSLFNYTPPSHTSLDFSLDLSPTDSLNIEELLTKTEYEPTKSLYFFEQNYLRDNSRINLMLEDSKIIDDYVVKLIKPSTITLPYHYETWYIENPTPNTSIDRILSTYYSGKIDCVTIHCKNKGTSGYTKVDIKVNGESIFKDENDCPILEYNSSSSYAKSTKIFRDWISKEDLITLDVLNVADNCSGLTVTLSISQPNTLLKVHSIKILDEDGNEYDVDNIMSTTFPYIRFKIIFNTSVLVFPNASLYNSDSNINFEFIEAYSTYVSNDTLISDYIDTSELSGQYTLLVKDGISLSGIYQEVFTKNYTFYNTDIYNFIEYDEYTSTNLLEVKFNEEFILNNFNKFSYSLNGTDWTEQENLTNPITINITDTSVGGNNNEEEKTIYLKLINTYYNKLKILTLTTKYYYSSITFDILSYGYYDVNDKNNFIIKYSLPDSSINVPPYNIKVFNNYDDSVLYEQIYKHIPLSEFSYTINDNGDNTANISISDGYILDNSGNIQYIESANIDTDEFSISESRIYVVYVDLENLEINIENKITKGIRLSSLPYPTNATRENIQFISQINDFLSSDIENLENKLILYGILIYTDSDGNILYEHLPYSDYFEIKFKLDNFPEDGLKVTFMDKAGRESSYNINNEYKPYNYSYKVYKLDYYSQELTNGSIITDDSGLNNIYIRFFIDR